MKTCIKCNTEKVLDDFPKSKLHPQGRHTYCRDCQNKNSRRRFAKQIKEYKELISDLGCTVCGMNHSSALEVHHLHTSYKRYGRSQSHRYNLEDLQNELAVLLCANCHGIFHGYYGGKNAPFEAQTRESVCDIVNSELKKMCVGG